MRMARSPPCSRTVAASGGMAVHERNGMVVGGRNIAYKPFDGGETVVLLDRRPLITATSVTTISPRMRLVASMRESLGSPVFEGTEQIAGDLYLIDLDGSSRIVGRDVQLTNGLGFSPDDGTLYHSDSRRQTVFCYAVGDDGDLGPKEAFRAHRGRRARPAWRWPRTVRFGSPSAGGSEASTCSSRTDVSANTSGFRCRCAPASCFGGDDLKDLYIVTGSPGAATDREGTVFRTRTEVAGLPVPEAKVPIG